MESVYIPLSTGIPGLDKVLQNIMPGDNVVWQIDSVDEYVPFVRPFAKNVVEKNGRLIYFRFSSHKELLSEDSGAEIYHIDPHAGFETAAAEIHKIMAKAGRGVYFIFDCLSDLAEIWCSDLMLGNFFILTCPYVYDMDSFAYFAFIRNRHSLHVAASIRDTTQIFLDVYRHKNNLYIHPMKVWQRHSPTMYMPHIWDGDGFSPVTSSADVSEVVSEVMDSRMGLSSRIVDIWDRIFIQAEEALEALKCGEKGEKEVGELYRRLMRMVFSRDEHILELASKYLSLSDILAIQKRLIGSGFIGGKSVGMITARAILRKSGQHWKSLLETHDSFYIGSDVFYTYIVRNGLWRVRQKQRDKETFLDGIDDARQRMLTGDFPEFITNQFVEMLDYFGQSPIIVRSSSLLEDNFGNAFSGKYKSVFCVNQGTRTERLKAFLSAVREVYASTMGTEALMYRSRRGLLDSDEQMALLVQRVSGAVYDNLFTPQIAGVGLSFNPYAWSKKIKPEAGMLRLVCGLGTRAVDRHDDDYTRVISLNEPKLRPETNFDEVVHNTQRKVDVLDLHDNVFTSKTFEGISTIEDFPVEIVATKESDTVRKQPDNNEYSDPWVLTFEPLLSKTTFVETMRSMLQTLHSAYNYPVDIEFTANFLQDDSYQINLVQCRPFQITGKGKFIEEPENPESIKHDNLILESYGSVIGPSMVSQIDRIVYVDSSVYGELPERDRYAIARLIGRLTHHKRDRDKTIMLIGPGRWGTSTSSLGIPVNFAEINTVTVLCELVEMNENLVPDVSLGTHFFNDIVEFKMLYIAVFPNEKRNFINKHFLENSPNKLETLLPGEEQWSHAVRVIDISDGEENKNMYINANALRQRVLCYLSG